jgi:hypothetical protein
MTDRCRANAVEQLRTSDKRHAEASCGEQNATNARIVLHIMDAALNRADAYGISDKIRLKTRLDGE